MNKVAYTKPKLSDVVVAPSPIRFVAMVDFHLNSWVRSPSHDVPLIICFRSLVFLHHGGFDLKLIGTKDPQPIYIDGEVFASPEHLPGVDHADHADQLDSYYESSDDEIYSYGKCPIFMTTQSQDASGSDLSANH